MRIIVLSDHTPFKPPVFSTVGMSDRDVISELNEVITKI